MLALALLLSCSDYELEPKNDGSGGEDPRDTGDGTPEIPPDISVSPEELDLGALCGQGEGYVLISNQGAQDLTVTGLSVSGSGWTVDDPATPFTVEHGEPVVVTLTGTPADATLIVESDDPDEPTVEVPLAAMQDSPPEVNITAPGEDDVLPIGGDVTLAGQVGDDSDALDTLELSWSSDASGVIATDSASSAGAAESLWLEGDRSGGEQSISLTATDSCGQSTTDTVTLCQQAGYTEESLDISGWHFEGDSIWDSSNNWLQITDATTSQVGSAFETSTAVSGENVNIAFSYYVSGGSGADGIAITALDVDRMTTFLASSGGYLGYYDGAGTGFPGWTIELDTYHNGYDPTSEDHLAFVFDGNAENTEVWVAIPDQEDGAWHTMEVDVTAPHVTVSIDGVAYIDQDIDGYYAFNAYVGFSGATGALTNYHLIDALEVTEYVCADEGDTGMD